MFSNGRKVTRNLRVICLLFAIFIVKESIGANVFDRCEYNFHTGYVQRGCDLKIYAGYLYNLKSPNYPYSYEPYSSCRCRYTAPLNHNIVLNCTINLDKGADSCSTESFYIAGDGNRNLDGVERLCGYGTFTRESLFRSLVLSYLSEGSYGNFECSLWAKPQACDCGWSVTKNIANGEETTINEYPSMVALTVQNVFYCSAVIISHRYMLTAAHCIDVQPNHRMIKAWVGRHNIESAKDTKYAAVYNINKIIVHPGYKPYPSDNDIALLQTTKDIEFSRGVAPICLPPPSNANNEFAWENVDVIGWGATKFTANNSPTLQKITVMVTDNETCKRNYENQDEIFPTHICTSDLMGTSKDSCQSDSGGPVIFKHKGRQFLVGIISYGKACGIGKNPIGVNTRVTSYLNWIYQNTGRTTCTVQM